MTPNFLCIGAQKAGTAWLYDHLKTHPNVWLPPFKELHYFNHSDTTSHIKNILFRKGTHLHSLRKLAQIPWSPSSLKRIFWYATFFLKKRNDKWYKSLFQPESNQITGELTPGYARLDSVSIARIHKMNPELKVVYILRDPVDRAISQLRMRMKRKILFDKYGSLDDEEQLEAKFQQPGIYKNSDYLNNLKNWLEHFPKKQILILFFDEMIESPDNYLKKILDFLKIDNSLDFIHGNLNEKKNSYEYPIPDMMIRRVNEMFLKDIEMLHTTYNNDYTAKWLKKAKKRSAVPKLTENEK